MSGFLSELKIAKHYYDHERTGPVMVDLHPTLACQNKCYYCVSENVHVSGTQRQNFNRKHTLEWNTLETVIREWRYMKVRAIQLTGGGEPTLYYKFPELLHEIQDFSVGMITNGVLVKKYVNDIYDAVNWIRFSLDASNPEMYRAIKTSDNFDKTIDSLEALVAARHKKPLRIGVAYIITADSVDGIKEVTDLMNSIGGIDYLQFKDVISRGITFNEEYKKKIDFEIENARRTSKIPVLYTKHGGDMQQKLSRCLATNYVSVLGADGNVYGCCHLEYVPKYSFGSVYEKSYQEIWQNRPPMEIDNKLCWNCRFMKMNEVLHELSVIQDEDFI